MTTEFRETGNICELQVAETRTKGTVSGKVYGGYFQAGGNWCVIATVILLCALAQACATCSDFFISQWVNMEEKYVIIVSFIFHNIE